LHILYRFRGGLPLDHRQQVEIVETAQHQDHNLESHSGYVSDHHYHSFRPPSESTGGVGKEEVQPDSRNQQVRKLAHRIQERLARPLQDGELGDEPSQDHQWPEGAIGPPSPCDDSGENVRESNPAD